VLVAIVERLDFSAFDVYDALGLSIPSIGLQVGCVVIPLIEFFVINNFSVLSRMATAYL